MSKNRLSSDSVILALDLGTSFVKAILAKKTDGGLKVIGSGRAQQFSGSMRSGAITDIPTVISVCEQAVGAAEKVAGIRAKTAIVGISGEFVKGKTSIVHYRRDKNDKPISEAEMSVVLKKVQDKARESARSEIAVETMNPNAEVRLINSSIVSIIIDGQTVNNPIGFRGNDVTIRFYTAFAPLVQISAIEKVCAELNLDLIAVVVEPFAIGRAYLSDENDSNCSCIIVDVGGGTTDITLIRDGGIECTGTFALGGNCIKKDLQTWLGGLEISLEEFFKFGALPNKIILSGGGAKNSDLGETLATSDWYKKLDFSRRPIISTLDPSELDGFIYDSNVFELDEAYVTGLGLLKVACDVLAEDHDKKLHHKIARILQN